MCVHLFLPKIHVFLAFSTRPTFHFQKHQLPTTYGMVHWRRATVDGRRSTAHHATPLPRHNSTGESKTNFEWYRLLSVGCQAGPSTPCIPLIVGSRCRDNSRQAAECSGLAPFHVHRLGELSVESERRKGKSKMMLITHN